MLAARVAPAVAALEAAVLAVLTVLVVVELVLGRSSSVGSALAEAVLSLVVAAGLAALAVTWRRAPDRARTPALVWHVLLVPVVISLFQSAQALYGGLLAAAVLVGLVSAGAAGPSEPDPDGVAEGREDEPEGH
ncbi:hypothetical protein [Lapillicoccus jejuensis]|uniref:Uncharacterized protein n=1 Tax=Lapillicoccus jejuensis TaxID=402171 RepID=A0A542E2R9_9MICO|nr:hypothetical protein [Lapillicoccus jejuensis]TQJ09589.1 hypothetical protein FB458_2701 [Lapillicoccus jejuensis]